MIEVEVLESIMQSAGQEALVAGYAEITPVHLAIALSRFSERELSHSTAGVIAAVRREFEDFGIEPRTFRRRLRGVWPIRPSGLRFRRLQGGRSPKAPAPAKKTRRQTISESN